MESGNGGASSKGVLIPVPDSSDVFLNSVLASLQSAYLYEESKQFFRYKSAVLVQNPILKEKYNALRAKRKEAGYSEEDLKESYGFLLFDDVTKANAIGEAGVLAGNSTCTTLGDPSKGVYISMYSDCLDLNRWYHGKSGYIAIIRLTKGRVKKVLENYTQNFTAPTVGYDCHVSEQLPSVSAKTSSFLAFERTQYYMYELLDDGSNKTARCPSAACPFAIVSFSYTDTKATPVASEEKSEMTKLVCHYLPWRGQLQIGSQFYSVGMRCTTGALIPAQLPSVVKVDRAISMSDLRKLLPRAVFETCIASEAFLDGLYCSLCELVPAEGEETSSLAQLLCEIKEKDLSLTVPLNDGGFLILLHSSHFLTYDDSGSSATDVLQGMFVFPESRAVVRDTKSGLRNSTLSSEIHRVLPLLSYAEGEVEKTPIDPSEDLCEVLVQHMQSYAALINPGLAFSPSREVNIFPDQYDVPDAHKDLYSSPEWSNRAWQSLKSYLGKQASFQLPVSKASEILAAGEEERREDLDDDVYICVSSPEEAPASPVSKGLEDHLSDQKSLAHVETSADGGISSAELQVDLPTVPQNVVPDNLQTGDATKDNEKCSDLIVLNKTDDMEVENILTPLASHDLPAELIVSITSAGRSVTDKAQGVVSTVSTRRHSDFPFSGLLHTSESNSVSDETDKTVLDCSKDSSPPRTKQRKLRSRLSKGQEEISKGCVATPILQTPQEKDSLNNQSDEHNEESSDHTHLSNPSRTHWRKLRRKRKFGKLSAKNKKARFATVGLAIAKKKKSDLGQPTLESTISMHLEAGPLKKKTERWDLKAVISECGRVLVPHGSVDIADQIKSLKNNLQPTKVEQCPEKMLLDAPVNAAEMEQVSSTAPETAVDETETTEGTDDGNHVHNVTVHHVDPEQGNSRQPDGESPSVPLSPETKVHSSKKDDTVTPPSPPEQEKRTDTLPQGRSPAKGEFLFSKLKSVILRGKRKANLTMTEDTTANASPDSEPCLKKDKVDSNIEALNRNNGATQSTDVGVEIVSKVLSVDPLFAYALGLTPKDSPDKVQKAEDQDTQQRKDSTVMIELTSFDKEPKIIHRPPSIFPRGTRIKTLKKHQGIPAEYIRKKWWLHFQTPACFASEKLNNKDCTRDNSVRKTIKEKVNSACSSTDALNLLADLALSASNDQVLPQPNPALERKPETSLKKSDLIKGLSSSEQESVLHALLRQPAARSIQALESPSPSQLVGDSELVGLISKEHGYSLPPSSSLLLGLPGTPFQVCPVSGSTRLLHHPQTVNGDGVKTLQPSVGQEDRSDHNNRTPEYLKKYMIHRQKFRDSRNFVNKEGSIQVTRQWKENYDFSLDSKFTGHSKEKAIIRALHGPWDFSVQDTSEEDRLIFHMWIGLFYSRSTARFFHVDSNFAYPCSEDGNSLDISSGIMSKPASPALKDSSPAASPSTTDTSDSLMSKALDLSKKPNPASDQESVILDLSLRNTNAEAVTADPQVHRKETSVSSKQKEAAESLTSLKSPAEPSTFQCFKKMIHSTKMNSEVKDDRSTHESEKTSTPSQNSVCLEHTDVPSFRNDGTLPPPQTEMRRESVELETVRTALGIGRVLHGSKKESTHMRDGTENPETTEMTPKDQLDSSRSVTDKAIDCNMEAGDVVITDESKDEESCEMKEDPSHESNTNTSPKVVHTGDDSANKDSSIVCNGHYSDSEELVFKEKPKAVSPGQPEKGNVDVDCKGKVIKDEDYFSKEHGLGVKKRCISAVKAYKNLSDHPLPVMPDGSDLVNADCIAESNHQAQLDEQTLPADGVKVACYYSPSKLPCTNNIALTDDHAISEKVPHTPSEMQPTDYDPAAEERSETAVPMSDEGTGSLDESCLSVPQKKDSVVMENQNPEMSDFSLDFCRNAHEDPESMSTEGEDKIENVTQKESFHHQSPLPQYEVLKQLETEENFIEETDLNINDTNEEQDKSCGGVYIPFIGIATCGEDTLQTHDSHPQDKVQKVVQGHEKIPFISDSTDPETVLPNDMCSAPKITAELFPCKLSILDSNETNHPVILGSESDSRCPTPTMDENPFGCIPSCGPSISTSAVSRYDTCKNSAQKGLRSSTPIKDDPLLKQNLCHTSTGKSDPNLHHDLHPDLEQRTLRVLQSIDKFLAKSSLTGISRQIKTADITESFAPIPNHNSKYIPIGQSLSHTSADIKTKKRSNEKPAASDRWDLHTVSSDCPHTLPFENALEEVHAKFQLERTNSSSYFERPDEQESLAGQDVCHSNISSPAVDHLHAMKPNMDQDRHKATTQPNLNHEPRPYSQRPVMAVKPSKSEESQAGPSSKDMCIENSAKNKQTITPAFKYASAISKLLERKRKATSRANSKGLHDDECEASELSSKSTWQANVSHSKPNSDEVKFASHQYQGRDISEFTAIPSSSAKSSPKIVDASQDFFIYSSAEKVDRTAKKNIEMHQTDVSDTSTSFMDPADNSRIDRDDSVTLGTQSSIVCTVFNSDRRKSSSFLEQLSQRCLQDDITQTSVEKECLIFSEKMKQLLKKRKGEAVCQQDTHDRLRDSCTSPLTVCFSNLEEQDDSLDLMDTSVVGQKIKVDMSDRENRTDTTETLHPEELPQTPSNPMENAWISGMTAECARLYEATMQDICAVEKISFKPKGFRTDYTKTEPSNHFDFCDQMKKEMDEAFRSSLNSVVKKSCKTKYRFYILVTSDDVFFEETKRQLQAEGHTAVQPSEFFLGEESSSSLLIILRNEDIAEHICEVPHLLELKKSPAVQFAGIDEPDDVVNLTHQELFTRGGFIMFDRAALEHLSLCNMKKLSEILQELSTNGKWKWMLHYRDSRRLKENARLSADAKEKKDFLHWGQDTGILEVLPYHECDLMSRDQPDYLTCLMRLQVQNVSSRFPVFITDTTADSAFERNGILTITLNSFLTKSPSETFTV